MKQKCVTQSIIDSTWRFPKRTLNSNHQGQHMNADYKNLFPLSIATHSLAEPSLCPLFVCQKDRSTNHKQWGKWQSENNKVKKKKNHEKRN